MWMWMWMSDFQSWFLFLSSAEPLRPQASLTPDTLLQTIMRTTLRSLNPSSRLTFTGGSHFRAYSNDVPWHLVVMTMFRARAFTSATKYVLAVNTPPDVPRHIIRSSSVPADIFRFAVTRSPSVVSSISTKVTYAGHCQNT